MRQSNGSMAIRPTRAAVANRRKWARHPCGAEVSCRLILGEGTGLPVTSIQNLSAGGVNLVLSDLVPTGKVVTIELRHEQRQVVLRREARVTYVFRAPDGRFTLGAAFAWELGLSELEQLL